jgi:hypothetical protein
MPIDTNYVLAVPVESSTLPTRAKNVLKRLGCATIADTTKLTPPEILRAKWAGKKVLAYIQTWLGEFGLSLTLPAATKPTPTGFPLLNGYFQAQQRLFDYFGYREDWVHIPLDDRTADYWLLQERTDGSGRGLVTYAPTELTLELFLGPNLDRKNPGTFYGSSIYQQRFLKKWVYRGKDYTMICVDTHTDGNKFLAIFDNKKEVTPATYGAQYGPLVEAAKSWDLFGDIAVPLDMQAMGFKTLEEVHNFSAKGGK